MDSAAGSLAGSANALFCDGPEVFLVDDDPAVLSALGKLLRGAGYRVRSFASAHEFLLRDDPRTPGCAVLDMGMKEIDGFSMQMEMEERGDERPIIFISEFDDVATGVKAMKAGATDYLVKPLKDTDLLAAIEEALRIDEQVRRHHRERRALKQSYDQLTPRERQVMARVVQGYLNKQIAYELGIVEKTVKVHRARVMEKMGVRSIAALVRVGEELHVADARVPDGRDEFPLGGRTDAPMQPRVAILHDDLSVCSAISRLLKDGHIAAEACSSIGSFLEGILHERAPECVVLDLQMPGMSGFDVMDCLSRAGMRVPFVIITPHDEPVSRNAGFSAGAFRCLHKPLDATELLESITEAIEAGPQSAPAA